MRTKTRILWTILLIDFLLLLAESESMDPTTTKPTTTQPPTAKPTTAESTSITSSVTDPTTTKSLAIDPTTTKSLSIDPTTTKPPSTEPATIKLPASGPTSIKLPASGPTSIKPTATEPKSTNPPTTDPNSTRHPSTEPTSIKPSASDPISTTLTAAESTTPKPTPANPTSAAPARTQATQAPSSVVTTRQNPASDQTSTLSRETPASTTVDAKTPAGIQTTPDQTTQAPFISSQEPDVTVSQTVTSKPIIREAFNETITLDSMQEPGNKENISVQACLMLLEKLIGNVSGSCILTGEKINGYYAFTSASVAVDPKVIQQFYDNMKRSPPDSTPVPHTLIAILSSCGALVLILVIFALYCTYHHRSYRKNQQHLTEELQTVENGYHDNPTLEVMEVQPEMQEKKVALNGEFNDSWIVPFDNLAKEEIPDEEDTHL